MIIIFARKYNNNPQNLAKKMKPKKSENQEPQLKLFKTRLETFLNPRHPLCTLSFYMDWKYFEETFGETFLETGRPGLPTRLMAGLSYLKYTYNLSDEKSIEEFQENGYWQYFCGYEYFQHEIPCDPSSMTRWRNRIGEEGMKKLLSETLRMAHRFKILKTKDLEDVIVDTTVQEKNITYPTDAKLLNTAREKLVEEAKEQEIPLRQSYLRLGKNMLHKYSGYVHAKQFKRAKKVLKKLKTYLGRVCRDIERKCEDPGDKLKELLILCKRLLQQKRESKNKVYSVHEPHVECISKGKAKNPYEFGCKTSVVITAKSNWVIGIQSLHGNPYDGHTLKEVIADAEDTTSIEIKRIFVDKGYRGKDSHPEGKSVYISGRRRLPAQLKKLLRRRSSVEPIIGHMKREHRLGRNYLKGIPGDLINAVLCGVGFNFRKLLRYLELFFARIITIIFLNFNQRDSLFLPASSKM